MYNPRLLYGSRANYVFIAGTNDQEEIKLLAAQFLFTLGKRNFQAARGRPRIFWAAKGNLMILGAAFVPAVIYTQTNFWFSFFPIICVD